MAALVARALLPALACSLASVAFAQDCVTPIGVPCYTIQMERKQWDALSFNPSKIRRTEITTVRALRPDGSRSSRDRTRTQDLFGRPAGGMEYSSLYLAPDNSVVSVNYIDRTIARREPLIWHDRPFRNSTDYDSTCTTGIRRAGSGFEMQGNASVAGVPVVKWRLALGHGGYEEQYLAPSLDCTSLKRYRIDKNALWLPALVDSWEATSVVLGEPAAVHFALPADYRAVEDPHKPRLQQVVEANGRRAADRQR